FAATVCHLLAAPPHQISPLPYPPLFRSRVVHDATGIGVLVIYANGQLAGGIGSIRFHFLVRPCDTVVLQAVPMELHGTRSRAGCRPWGGALESTGILVVPRRAPRHRTAQCAAPVRRGAPGFRRCRPSVRDRPASRAAARRSVPSRRT